MRSARMRACTFCRVSGVSVSPGCSIFSTASSSRSKASSMDTIASGTPSSRAAASAAARVSGDE